MEKGNLFILFSYKIESIFEQKKRKQKESSIEFFQPSIAGEGQDPLPWVRGKQ